MARLIFILLLVGLTACTQKSIKGVKATLDKQVEADNYYAQNNCDRALPLYQSLAETMPSDTKSLLRIGNCQARAKNFEQAEQAYQQALMRDNQFVKAWYNLAYIQARVLANTVTEMYKHVDPESPEAKKIRMLTVDVLAPFDIKLDTVDDVN